MYYTTSYDNSKKVSLQKRPSIIFNDISFTKSINLDTSTNTLLIFVTPSCDNCMHVLEEVSNNKMNYSGMNIVFIIPGNINESQSIKLNYPEIVRLNSYFVSDSNMVIKERFEVKSYPTTFFYKHNKLIIKINGEFKSGYLDKYLN